MFRQEKCERRPVASISHQVYHTGNVECHKCASHDMQARDVPAPPARNLRLPRPRTEAVAFLGNGESIVQVSVLIKFAKFQAWLSSNGARNQVEYDAYW